jgi:hypothetical protein
MVLHLGAGMPKDGLVALGELIVGHLRKSTLNPEAPIVSQSVQCAAFEWLISLRS